MLLFDSQGKSPMSLSLLIKKCTNFKRWTGAQREYAHRKTWEKQGYIFTR